MTDAAHNNGMHPTPHHEVSHVSCAGARVMPGVMSPPRVESMKSPAASQLNALNVVWIMRAVV